MTVAALLFIAIALPSHRKSSDITIPPCAICGGATAAAATPDTTITHIGLGVPYAWADLIKQTDRPTLPPYYKSDTKVIWSKTTDYAKLFLNLLVWALFVITSGTALRIKKVSA